MSETATTTPLHIHTLDTLLDELVSGRTIALNDEGRVFQIAGTDARSVFAWYRDHRNTWARSVAKEDIEAIVSQLDTPAPVMAPTVSTAGARGKRILLLKSIRAHRFGGIHRFGTVDEAPAEFTFTFEKPVTLVEGMNGAGKTSFLSAIQWCLTGYVHRPLRPPELANRAISVIAGVGDAATQRVMSPITPLPPASVIANLGDNALPLDTWVELGFTDEQGNPAGTLKRKMQRGPHNSVVVKEPDLSALGLDRLACEVGTRMPALLPYIELGAASDLGTAVAALIGIKPLQDLAAHAQRVQNRLKKELPKERQAEIRVLDDQFVKMHRELTELLAREPAISHRESLPSPASDNVPAKLADWQRHFEGLQTQTLVKARDILGADFDHSNTITRADLMKNVGPALGTLDPAQLGQLVSARRLAALGKLSEEHVLMAETLVQTLRQEAKELDELSQRPAWAARLWLYVRVAGWMRDHSHLSHEVETCPLCQSALADKTDTVSGKPIADHLRQLIGTESQFLEKTATAWEKDALARLRDAVGQTLQAELNFELPAAPSDLITAAFAQELFQPQCLKGCLAVLKTAAHALCAKAVAELPAFEEPDVPVFAGAFGSTGTALATALRRLARAIAFARWRRNNEAACHAAFTRIIGQPATAAHHSAVGADEQPLHQSLLTLDNLVRTAEPINHALTKLDALAEFNRQRSQKQGAIERYERAATAIDELLGLPALVETQVAFLMKALADATAQWKEKLYSPAFIGAPAAVNPNIGPDGTIAIDAAADGTQAPAQHVGNTAELRATLFAFFLALWEHLLDTRGGIGLLLLDDPQELFDRPNQRRIANTIPSLTKKGARIITTTLDPGFGRDVKAAVGRELGRDELDHRRIHPIKAIRQHIVLGSFIEAVEEKRRAFEHPENENEAQPARDYVNALRICVENRLVDFFDLPEPRLPRMFTLSDLLDAIRRRVNCGMDAFADPAFQALVSMDSLTPGSSLLSLLNESHHGRHDQIQYTDVVRAKDHCVHALHQVEAAHEAYERWLRRDPREAIADRPEAPAVLRFPSLDVPVFGNIAAFTAENPPGEAIETGERFSTERLSHHALYVISTGNLGFAAPKNCRAIVDLSEETVADNRLVIAMYRDKLYARRLFRDDKNPGFVVLASDAIDPHRRPPSLHVPAQEVRLLKIVGILFDGRPHYPRPVQEAVTTQAMSCLEKIEIAFRVRGTSAEPLALDGQTVLGGRCLTPEDIASMEDSLVAVATEDAAIFKRVGKSVPGGKHVRHLDAIGGRGESTLIRLEEVEDDPFDQIPLLQSARQVLGILYE